MRVTHLIAGAVGVMLGGGTYLAASPAPAEQAAGATESLPANAIVASALDASVDACDDFYRRACGGFVASEKLAAGTPAVNLTAQQFEANLDRSLKTLFAQDRIVDPELQRLKVFYASCLTENAVDTDTVRRWLERIDRASTRAQIQSVMRALSMIGVDPFFSYSGQPDRTRWTRYRGELNSPFLWGDEQAVAREFELVGQAPAGAERDAKAVAAIVATLSPLDGDRYDAKTAENPKTLKELRQLAPSIDWTSYLAMVGARLSRPINVTSPDYVRAVSRELASGPIADLRAFLRWSFLFSLRGELPKQFQTAFADIGPALSVKTSDPAGRCRDATVRAMGVEFSRQYAKRILGWQAREAARQIARDIKAQIVSSVAGVDWLSENARRATSDKLAKTDLKIGFPDKWPAVGNYRLEPGRFLDNVLAARKFEQRQNWDRANRVRDRTQWEMIVRPWVGDGMAAARLVVPNGFPDAFSNSLIMTAAFLGPPRFDAKASPELNYATFGAIFAHEFVHVAETHEFKSDGSSGELWSAADVTAEKGRAKCLIDQADGFEVAPGLKLPGKREYDENVADLGGVRLAYEALKARLRDRIDRIDASGTSPAQRFFYKFAQNFCTAQPPEGLSKSVAVDRHGPPSFRVNGTLSNLPAFGRAFSCKAGSPMTRPSDKICRVW